MSACKWPYVNNNSNNNDDDDNDETNNKNNNNKTNFIRQSTKVRYIVLFTFL